MSWIASQAAPLPPEVFHRRHRGLLWFLAAHLVALPIFGVAMGWSLPASLLACAPAAGFLLPAALPQLGPLKRAIACVLGLLSCSAALVLLWHGQTEAHFDYFVTIGAVALYESWQPYVIAILFVLLQHGLTGAWMPASEFRGVDRRDPWLWAGVQCGFVGAFAVVNLVFWRESRETRLREKRAAREAARSAEHFETAFQHAPSGAALLDCEGRIVSVNTAFCDSLRCDAATLLGTLWIDYIEESASDPFPLRWPPHAPGQSRERVVHRIDGTQGWLLCNFSALADDPEPDAPAWMVQTHDRTRRHLAEDELAHRASHDRLTGLLARHAFLERAQGLLDSHPDGLSVIFVDIDDFKTVNDALGHAAGDRLIIATADRLRAVIREDDLLGRFGGDEFVICLADAAPDSAEGLAHRILAAFTEPFDLLGTVRTARVSVGVAWARDGERSIDLLLGDADLAVYESKARGKGRHTWFDLEMREAAQDRIALESDLRRALAGDEIVAYYQPQLDVDGRLLGFEALARWMHPTRGLISPGVFIPIAERAGLITPIGEYMLRAACEQLCVWREQSAEHDTLTMSVNVSPQSFGEPGYAATVAETLTASAVAPECVRLEITESMMIDNPTHAAETIAALKSLGVRLAIDDFGVGQSSLAQLSNLAGLDELKIDKQLIDHVADSPMSRRIVAAILDVADAGALNVIAEGVESAEQLDVLRELGCRTVQGFLFSPPLPPQQAQRFLATAVG